MARNLIPIGVATSPRNPKENPSLPTGSSHGESRSPLNSNPTPFRKSIPAGPSEPANIPRISRGLLTPLQPRHRHPFPVLERQRCPCEKGIVLVRKLERITQNQQAAAQTETPGARLELPVEPYRGIRLITAEFSLIHGIGELDAPIQAQLRSTCISSPEDSCCAQAKVSPSRDGVSAGPMHAEAFSLSPYAHGVVGDPQSGQTKCRGVSHTRTKRGDSLGLHQARHAERALALQRRH